MTTNDVLSCTPHEDVMTKATYRFKVWNLLENKDLVRFPRPCKGRTPNFVDSEVAAEKLTDLEIYKNAKVIKVNIDKPQEPVRYSILENGKTLLVTTPRLAEGVLMKVCPPPDATRQNMRVISRGRGASEYGKPISLEENIHVDMIVVGSVAVSKEGHRIGKGEGFSDLEYAVMRATGAIDDKTIVVTTVHDEQVFDKLPHELFQKFDVPVDYIVTPTQVIEVTPQLPKPKGILWNILSDRRFQLIPLLKTLRDKDMEKGLDCSLKDVDSEPEERPKPYYRPSYRRKPFQQRPRKQTASQSQGESRDGSPVDNRRRTRTFRRGGNRTKQVDGAGDAQVTNNPNQSERKPARAKPERKTEAENKENQQPQTRQRPAQGRRYQRRFYNKVPVDFSVKVGNIGSTVRVRDLKNALNEKGVRPRDITWKGARGFAYLHFAKAKVEQENEKPIAVDDVVASLQGLTVKCRVDNETENGQVSENLLSVEPAPPKPFGRIENAGVTAV